MTVTQVNITETNASSVALGDTQDPSDGSYIVASIILTFICLLGILGNGVTICLFMCTKKLRKSCNAFLINLTVADFLMSSVSYPMSLSASIHGNWLFGEAGCIFNGFWVTFFGLLSINTMTAIGVERYYAICRLVGAHALSPWKTFLVLILLWVVTLFWACAPLTPWNRYVLEGLDISCTIEYTTTSTKYNSFVAALLAGEYVIPLSITIFCYLSIFKKVRSNRLQFANFKQGKHLCGLKKRLSREFKLAKLCILIFTMYVISWTPYAVVVLICLSRRGSCILPPIVTSLPALCGKASAVYNPLIYVLTHNEIRKVVKRKTGGMKFDSRMVRTSSVIHSFSRKSANTDSF